MNGVMIYSNGIGQRMAGLEHALPEVLEQTERFNSKEYAFQVAPGLVHETNAKAYASVDDFREVFHQELKMHLEWVYSRAEELGDSYQDAVVNSEDLTFGEGLVVMASWILGKDEVIDTEAALSEAAWKLAVEQETFVPGFFVVS